MLRSGVCFEGATQWGRLLDADRVLMPADYAEIAMQLDREEQRRANILRLPERSAAATDGDDPVSEFYDQVNDEVRAVGEYERSAAGQQHRLIEAVEGLREDLRGRR